MSTYERSFVGKRLRRAVIVLTCLISVTSRAGAQTPRTIAVVEETGGAVAGAQIVLRSPSGAVLNEGPTDTDGSYTLVGLPLGRYWLEVSARGFQVYRGSLEFAPLETTPVRIVLSLAGFQSEVTVTAERGAVADVERTAPVVTVREADEIRRRPLATLGNALEGATGVLVQQSTYGQASPFLRGLTGYQVLNLIDGVRFNNSTFRSGPNQYLAFVDPAQVQRIEAMLGPASSQFGSDALGGTIQLLTPSRPFASTLGQRSVSATANLFAASADRSAGADASAFLTGRNMMLAIGGSGRWLDDLRAGRGTDSHHVLRRLFCLSNEQIQDVIGSPQEDTGFTQSGFHTKLSSRLPVSRT